MQFLKRGTGDWTAYKTVIKGYTGEYPGEDQMSVCDLQLNQDYELVVRHFAREGPSRFVVGRVLPVYNGDANLQTRTVITLIAGTVK